MVRVVECALDGEDSGVSSLPPRSVVAAGVTAFGLDPRYREILLNQSLVELGQLAVGEVRDDADFLPGSLLDPSGHVELAHCDDIDAASLVVIGDGLRTQEASLLNATMSSTHDNGNEGWDEPQQNTNGTRRCG